MEVISQLSNSYKVVLFLILAGGMIVGLKTGKRIWPLVLSIIFAPIITSIGYNFLKGSFSSTASDTQLIIGIVAVIAIVAYVLRALFGKQVSQDIAASAIYDLLKFLFLLPFRILMLPFKLFSRRRH